MKSTNGSFGKMGTTCRSQVIYPHGIGSVVRYFSNTKTWGMQWLAPLPRGTTEWYKLHRITDFPADHRQTAAGFHGKIEFNMNLHSPLSLLSHFCSCGHDICSDSTSHDVRRSIAELLQHIDADITNEKAWDMARRFTGNR